MLCFLISTPFELAKKRVFASQIWFSANGNTTFLRVDFGGFGGKRKIFKKKLDIDR
jgi:hypothetical protein